MNKIDLCKQYDIDKKIRDYEESVKLLELTINKQRNEHLFGERIVHPRIRKIIG